MIADSRTSVAFTGHRTYRGAAADALRRTVGELYARGFRNFLSGMAVGFDLAAAEAVLELRERVPGVRLVAAVPFRGQEMRFSPADKPRSWSRRHRSRTTSATLLTSPEASFSKLAL